MYIFQSKNMSVKFGLSFCAYSQPLPSSAAGHPPPEGHVQAEGEGQEQDREQAAIL